MSSDTAKLAGRGISFSPSGHAQYQQHQHHHHHHHGHGARLADLVFEGMSPIHATRWRVDIKPTASMWWSSPARSSRQPAGIAEKALEGAPERAPNDLDAAGASFYAGAGASAVPGGSGGGSGGSSGALLTEAAAEMQLQGVPNGLVVRLFSPHESAFLTCGVGSGECWMCGRMGHWSRDCSRTDPLPGYPRSATTIAEMGSNVKSPSHATTPLPPAQLQRPLGAKALPMSKRLSSLGEEADGDSDDRPSASGAPPFATPDRSLLSSAAALAADDSALKGEHMGVLTPAEPLSMRGGVFAGRRDSGGTRSRSRSAAAAPGGDSVWHKRLSSAMGVVDDGHEKRRADDDGDAMDGAAAGADSDDLAAIFASKAAYAVFVEKPRTSASGANFTRP